jgi:cytochrome b subunit of formate dehydrogenase
MATERAAYGSGGRPGLPEPDSASPVAHAAEVHTGPTAAEVVERYPRPVRWFHAASYLAILVLLGTGWWLLTGREGDPSPLARLLGAPDTAVHTWVGWAFAGLLLLGVAVGARAVRTFMTESLRLDSGDARWLLAWPRAVFTGRFARHEGHFDPGQRGLNILLTLGIAVAAGSGLGMVILHGGPAFAVLTRLHRWSTYLVTPLIAGHVLVAAGVLPGYRGVWRSMHLGGRLDAAVARRLWPGWLERTQRAQTQDQLDRRARR